MHSSFRLKALLTTGLLITAATAQASETGIAAGMATNLGTLIAAQGNHAFHELRDELKRNLINSLKPLLPAPSGDKGVDEQSTPSEQLPRQPQIAAQ